MTRKKTKKGKPAMKTPAWLGDVRETVQELLQSLRPRERTLTEKVGQRVGQAFKMLKMQY
jgi:hypothetical protein